MKTALFFLVGVALNVRALAQDVYLEYKLSGTVNGTSRVYTSAAGFRAEVAMQLPNVGSVKTATILPAAKPGTLITLNEQAKTYTESSLKGTAEKLNYDVKVVGNEKVGGYPCVHATVSVNGRPAMNVWTSKDLPGYESMFNLAKASGSFGTEALYRQLEAKGAGGMMVRMVTGSVNTELVKAERRSNPASLFAVPAGYTKSSFDPASMKNMPPAERQKAVRELMKQAGGKPQKP
jgi:hypothetical protein